MSSYLEAYGAAEASHVRRFAIFKWTAIIVASVAIVSAVLYFVFQTYPEERRVDSFIAKLKAKDYPSAYAMWGCTEAKPCRDYSYMAFMGDWGPHSAYANAAAAKTGNGDTCGTGVIVPVTFPNQEPVALWVERDTKVLGFSPDQECRKKRLRISVFLRSLFGKKPG